jgi:ectoine hydroxylase-related dioxygenase (phytanoyl-CoA dioxygenase family)
MNEYDRSGYTVYQGFLDSGQLASLLQTIEDVSEGSTREKHDKDRLEMEESQPPTGTLVRRIYEPCTHYQSFRELSESEMMLDAVGSLLGQNLVFHYSKVNMKPPAIGSVVEWHQDLAYYPLTNDSSVTLLIYLDDANVGNGCLQVLGGRHKDPLLNHTRDGYFAGKVMEPLDESSAIPLEGKAGTAVFMHCMTPHSSVVNTSRLPRRTLIMSYRAADAFPVYAGNVTVQNEAHVRQVRGKPSPTARFSFQTFPVSLQKHKTASLYELQALSSREQPG